MSDGVKHLKMKILITFIVVVLALVVGRLFWINNQADHDGIIHLELIDNEGKIVFQDTLMFYEGDTFFDILNRAFDLTCASASYQADPTCAYTFTSFAYQGKVILGIKGDDFDLSSDWSNTFLAFYVKHDDDFVLSTLGPSQIPFDDGDEFQIILESVWE